MPKLKGIRRATVMDKLLSYRLPYFQLALALITFLECSNLVIEARKYCDEKNPNVTKSFDKTCDKDYIVCVPGIGGLPRKCPEHLVFNPKRENCDIPNSCKSDRVVDRHCVGKPCGLHADPGCETYYICSGGNRIRKACPDGFFFDTDDKECQDPTVEEVVCFDERISRALEPTDIQNDTSYALDDDGTGPGPGPGSGPGTGPSSGPGTGPGSGPGTGPGSGPGTGPGSGPGPGSGTGSGPGSGTGSGPGSRSGFCPAHTFKGDSNAPQAPDKRGVILEMPKVTDFGKWQDWISCPKDQYVTALSVWKRTIEDDTGKFDHGGVVSMGFRCDDPLVIKKNSKTGNTVIGQCAKDVPDNKWFGFLECDDGAGVGIQISQQPDQKLKDDTATDNVKLVCSCGPEYEKFKPYHLKKPAYNKVGNQRGDWTEAKYCHKKQALCGLKTQFQDWVQTNIIKLEKEDMTGLNQLHAKCCDVPNPGSVCIAKEGLQYIERCNNADSKNPRPCAVRILIGVAYNKREFKHSISFYTSIGYTLRDAIPELEKTIESDVVCDSGSGECEVNYDKLDKKRIFRVAQHEEGEMKIAAITNARIHQVVVDCGIFKIYTNTLVALGKKKGGGDEDESYVI